MAQTEKLSKCHMYDAKFISILTSAPGTIGAFWNTGRNYLSNRILGLKAEAPETLSTFDPIM